MAIVKVEFEELRDSERIAMMFGDSYKRWEEQLKEYVRLHPTMMPRKAWESGSKWVGWGGLKWCPESEMQNQLNREGCQNNEPNNPKPRKYAGFKFKEMSISRLPI